MIMRPPVKWHGGKHYLAKRIIDFFPKHRIYLEPFGGAASVLLNKQPAEVETYNDLDHRITRLFRILRDRGDEFAEKVALVPYSQVEFDEALLDREGGGELDMAIRDFVRWRQSFGGKGQTWSCSTTRARGGMAGDVNAWWTSIDSLPRIIDRLKGVQIACRSAFDLIPRFDHPEGLIYCDPPYVHSTRDAGSRRVYHAELGDDDHRRLAHLLTRSESAVVISGYPSALYDELYSDWRRVDFDIANHASGAKTKARETECLWMNY